MPEEEVFVFFARRRHDCHVLFVRRDGGVVVGFWGVGGLGRRRRRRCGWWGVHGWDECGGMW